MSFIKFLFTMLYILSIVLGVPVGGISARNAQACISGDADAVADFICDNLSYFKKVYNNADGGSGDFGAAGVEYRRDIKVTGADSSVTDGVYLDFDADNGYMVIADDYTVYAFETEGDLPQVRNNADVGYNVLDGFGEYDPSGNFISIAYPSASAETWAETPVSSAGQYGSGDGEIYDADAYVADVYGSDYVLSSAKELPDFYFTKQADTGFYKAEGNCMLNACYNILGYLSINGACPDIVSPYAEEYVESDPYAARYAKKNVTPRFPDFYPTLYLKVRKAAIEKYGYTVIQGNPFTEPGIISTVASGYGYSLKINHDIFRSFAYDVLPFINAGYPVLWNTANSKTYQSHTMTVMGYRIYAKKASFLGINFYKYEKLLEISDNWAYSARYFDYGSYYGIGSFVTVQK